jgi:hypothetical protein
VGSEKGQDIILRFRVIGLVEVGGEEEGLEEKDDWSLVKDFLSPPHFKYIIKFCKQHGSLTYTVTLFYSWFTP